MKRTCLACNKALTGQQRKWCSNSCSCRAYANEKASRPLDYRGWVPQKTCAHCGVDVIDKPNAKYCSTRCRWDKSHLEQTNKQRQERSKDGKPIYGDVRLCPLPECQKPFIVKGTKRYCSKVCATKYGWQVKSPNGFGDRCAVYFRPCPDCAQLVCMTNRGGGSKVCSLCRTVRNQSINGRKNHARRALGPKVLSINEIAERDGCRCHICHRKVDLKLSGQAKWGPTIEHIVPVSRGGTNDHGNLALAHRYCNTARGNRGHSQLLLVA